MTLVVLITMVMTGCVSALSVSTSDVTPTPPPPTQTPIAIPTIAPPDPTPTVEGGDALLASNDNNAQTPTPEPTPTAGPTATPTPVPTPTADVILVPTSVPPSPQPTRAPQPTQVPNRAPNPVPRPIQPTAPRSSSCAGGQVASSNGCACPAGQAKRASDNQCTRLCRQSELTITHSCVCSGTLHDTGGQCVQRCVAGEIPDGRGGCREPKANG